MSDDEGHQLPNVIYPGILDEGEMVEWVERFYDEYYFRPKAAWRIVRKAMFDNHERKRLYKEAKEYLSLRAKRKKYVAEQKADRSRRPRTRLESDRSRTHDLQWKTRVFAIIVILSNAFGNFFLDRGMRGPCDHHAA